jgi:hypothetical protein
MRTTYVAQASLGGIYHITHIRNLESILQLPGLIAFAFTDGHMVIGYIEN